MKNCLLILMFLISKSALGQLNDNFNDGDFTNNPVWNGSNNGTDFSIIPNGNTYQLRSNSTQSSSNFYLSTANNLATETVWEFWCNLQFNTSSTNFVDVYLISDQENLQNQKNKPLVHRISSASALCHQESHSDGNMQFLAS